MFVGFRPERPPAGSSPRAYPDVFDELRGQSSRQAGDRGSSLLQEIPAREDSVQAHLGAATGGSQLWAAGEVTVTPVTST